MNNGFVVNPAYERCQQESVSFLSTRYRAACGDAPGLGKTRTAICAANNIGAQDVLVVTLAGVRPSWREHVSELAKGRYDIISFNETLIPQVLARLRPKYDVVIIDEGHRCKDLESQWTRAVYGIGGLASRGVCVWPLSGTFMPNFRPIELFPMLKTLCPAFAKVSYLDYVRRFCGGYFDGRAWRADGASNTDTLNELLKDFLISHTKQQAYPGRRAPVLCPVPLDLDPEYFDAVLKAEESIMDRPAKLSPAHEHFSQLGDSASLRRLTGLAVVPAVAAFVEAKLESAGKVVLFFQHTEVGRKLWDALAPKFGASWYAGGLSPEQQKRAVGVFQDPRCRLFIAQQQAAGSGINGLQGVCDTIVFAEPDWTPGETEQRVDRLDRMGTTSDLVTAYVLYARGTLGAAVWGVHSRKEAVGRRAGWR